MSGQKSPNHTLLQIFHWAQLSQLLQLCQRATNWCSRSVHCMLLHMGLALTSACYPALVLSIPHVGVGIEILSSSAEFIPFTIINLCMKPYFPYIIIEELNCVPIWCSLRWGLSAGQVMFDYVFSGHTTLSLSLTFTWASIAWHNCCHVDINANPSLI